MSFLRELLAFIVARRKFWLIPILALMLVLGGLLVLTKGSALAPFVYTLFLRADVAHPRDFSILPRQRSGARG